VTRSSPIQVVIAYMKVNMTINRGRIPVTRPVNCSAAAWNKPMKCSANQVMPRITGF